MGGPSGSTCRGPRPAHPAEGRVLRQADRQRDLAVEFRADQSGAVPRDGRLQRREPGARHAHARRGHRSRRRRSQDPAIRRLEVRGRPQSRGVARQGDFPERADAAHPVRAFDRDGAEAAAAHRAAVDQQVLRARSHAGEILHQVVRRQRPHRVRDLVGEPGRAPGRDGLRGVHEARADRRARRDRAGDRREAGQHHRLLRRRHAARDHPRLPRQDRTTSASRRRRCSPHRSTSPTPATSRCSSTRSSSRRSRSA